MIPFWKELWQANEKQMSYNNVKQAKWISTNHKRLCIGTNVALNMLMRLEKDPLGIPFAEINYSKKYCFHFD